MAQDKAIQIAGQRIKVSPFSDYHRGAIDALFVDKQLSFNLSRHSDFIGLAVEVICPTLPKSLYKKVGDAYRWLGTLETFAELINGLWRCYWEWELQTATLAADADRIDAAQEQLDLQAAALQEAGFVAKPAVGLGDPGLEAELLALE